MTSRSSSRNVLPETCSLDSLKPGDGATVVSVEGGGNLRQRFLDMGFIPGAGVRLVAEAPLRDPVEVQVQGYSISLRKTEAAGIIVRKIPFEEETETDSEKDFGYNLSLHEHNSHPGYGEEGKYHRHSSGAALPKGADIRIALIGQQNSGKTSLFNSLTGASRHVGNFPGLTVDRMDETLIGHPEAVVTDLPGICSLSTYTDEERLVRRFLLEEKPAAIINVIDTTNIERHLYLTMQLMELGIPMVLALNMMDELTSNGGSVRINEMERQLGIPVVPISAAKGSGLTELVEHVLHVARYNEGPARQDFCLPEEHGGAVHRCLHSLMHLVEDHAAAAGISVRFAADRLADDDKDVMDMLALSRNEREMVEHIVLQMEEERGLDRHAAMAEMRYSFIHRLCRHTVRKPAESREAGRSRRIDSVLVGRWTAVPSFIAIIAVVFWLTFDVIGAGLQSLLASGMSALSSLADAAFLRWGVNGPIRSLVIDAVFGGVGYVISFVPVILVLFFFLSMLEDSGYMARIAFVSDKLLRKIGLSGRSIVPMLISFGCSVPGVMATRTLPSSRDRRMTILLVPFMSCSAKIAVYAFLANAFFPGKTALVMLLLYLFGIVAGILYALVSKFLNRSREAAPFVMELPVYRLPIARNVGHLLWDKTKDFLSMAFSVIFIATLIIWALQSFDFRLNFVSGGDGSILSALAGAIAPAFNPIGLGDWRIVTSLISGFMAKESIVSTMQVLGAASLLTTASAASMLVFCLLYTPCVAAIASIHRELGPFWAAFVIVFQCALAWLCAWGVYMIML